MGTSRGRGAQVASALEDVGETLTEVADALLHEAEKIGTDLRAGLTALPEQLEEARQTVLATVEPYRPPRQYRRYVQIGVLVAVAVAVAAVVVARSRRAAADDDPFEGTAAADTAAGAPVDAPA